MQGRQESGPLLQVRNVQLGDCHVCRFTPSGRYLVCFSTAQHELLLYSYSGLQFGTHGEPDEEAPEVRLHQLRLLVHGLFGLTLSKTPSVMPCEACLVSAR